MKERPDGVECFPPWLESIARRYLAGDDEERILDELVAECRRRPDGEVWAQHLTALGLAGFVGPLAQSLWRVVDGGLVH